MIASQTLVEVIDGDNAGRSGRVVSTPWLGNWWHTWVTINVERDVDPELGVYYERDTGLCYAREWIVERASNVIVLQDPPFAWLKD
jgi:hypothetical protein